MEELQKKYDDLMDTMIAICDKTGYTAEIAAHIEKKTGSRKVSPNFLLYLEKYGFKKPEPDLSEE